MNRLWWDPFTRLRVQREMASLQPFYQPIYLGAGLWTRPFTRETVAQWIRYERGDRKLDRFIEPMLPFSLIGKSVLEIGANAGGNLLWCWRHGATACVGIESDERYFEQARWAKDTFTFLLRRDIPLTMYLGKAEDITPIRAYGRTYDLGLALATIYHVPAEHRVAVLRKLGEICRYVILQGNGLEDLGRGDGERSLRHLVEQAGLTRYSWMHVPHVRGLVMVVGR